MSTYMPSVDTAAQPNNSDKNTASEENDIKDKVGTKAEGGDPTLPNAPVAGGQLPTSSNLSSSPEQDRSQQFTLESQLGGPSVVGPEDEDMSKDLRDTREINKGEKEMDLQIRELPSSQQQRPDHLSSRPPSRSGSSNVSAAENTDVPMEPAEKQQRPEEETELRPPQQSQLLQLVANVGSMSSPTPVIPALEAEPTNFGAPITTETPSGTSPDPARSLNVNDALGYLDEVKNRFQTKPDVYNHFLEIMKDFKSKRIDTPRVIERVSLLFAGHPALIQGFNTFLPPGYRIECMTDRGEGGSMIRVTTPHGTMMQNAGDTVLGEDQIQTQGSLQSSADISSRPWVAERSETGKSSTNLEGDKDKNGGIGESMQTDTEESLQLEYSARLASRLPSQPASSSNVNMDAQLTDKQLHEQLESLHLPPQQQRAHPHIIAITNSNARSASPSPAPPPSSMQPSAGPQRMMPASTSGGNSEVGSGLTSTLIPTTGSVFGTGGPLDPTRSLNVNDALGYLDEVKNRFQNNPDVYNRFLEIMKDFKSQRIDTPGVIERVSMLFAGHPALIQGFNTFLPPGYRIECMTDPEDEANSMIRVTTPQGTMMQSAKGLPTASIGEASDEPHAHLHGSSAGSHVHVHTAPVLPAVATTTTGPMSIAMPTGAQLFVAASGTSSNFAPGAHPSELQPTEQALEYVNRIKERYADDPASYHLFLDLLQNFNRNPEEVLQQIVLLFSHAPDLLEEFKMFLPKDGIGLGTISGSTTGGSQSNLMRMFTQSVEAVQAQVSVQLAQQTHDGSTKLRRIPKDRGEGAKEDKDKVQGQGQDPPSTTVSVSPQKRKRKPAEKDGGTTTGSKVTVGGTSTTGTSGLGPSKAKKAKHLHHETSPAPYRDRETGGSPYTNMYQPPHLQTQHTHFHPDVYSQPQFHLEVQAQPHPQSQLESQVLQDTTFFDRVRQFLDNRETYDEFLKLLNLFTQELINLRTLVFQAKSFLGETELMAQFREMVGWEERGNGGNGASNHASGDMSTLNGSGGGVGQIIKPNKVDLNIRYGPSYRRLPPSETQVVCSGRDAFCNSVLNDEWVSHPSWVSEDSGFIAHKKNIYEEALHRSEEERHEYDFYLEAMNKTISALETFHTKILQMSDAERINYKIKPNWNGSLKTIHQRLLKKVYGREAGMEVVQAIQDNPALAVPIVFQRLKQKEEEWKRAQREWNKVWREVDARNYWKSLDHQGVTFKMNDKKNITTKAFVTNIELVRQQQVMKRASLVDATFGRGPPDVIPSTGTSSSSQTSSSQMHGTNASQPRPRYQLAYTVEDNSVLQDAIKLVLSFLDRTHGTIPVYDRKKIEQFIRYFIPLFFMFYQREFDSAFAVGGAATGGVDLEDIMTGDGMGNIFAEDEGLGFGFSGGSGPSGSVAGSTRSKNGKRVAGDIRKKVLKATQSQSQTQQSLLQMQLEKSTRRTRSVASASASVSASAPPSAPGSRGPSPPASGDAEVRDDSSVSIKKLVSNGGCTGASISHGKLLNNASTGFQPPTSGFRKHVSRRGLFFANTPLYVLLRLLNLLYSRLLLCKILGAELAEAEKAAIASREQQSSINPPTSTSSFASNIIPDTPAFAFAVTTSAFVNINNVDAIGTSTVGAEHFYGHLLECCERLFDNQIDQATFEDTARYMFGMKAYNVFTIDKVVGAIIKQIQLILSDNKNKDLVQLLQKERDNPSMSLQDQNSYREKAGAIVGPDDHLYRINYIPDSRTLTIQLLGKDDSKDEDTLSMIEKWETYVDVFQTDCDLSASPPRGRYPFLRKTPRGDKSVSSDALFTRNNMETRFCMRTYRMFFVSHTEDVLYWRYPKGVFQEHKAVADKRVERRLKWIKGLDENGRMVGMKVS